MKRLFLLLLLMAACGRVGDTPTFPLEEAHPERSMLARWAQKEVLDVCLVDDMEEEGRWTVREGKPEPSYTREHCVDGVQALRQRVSLVDWEHIQNPADRTPWDSFGGDQGGWTCVALEAAAREDWEAAMACDWSAPDYLTASWGAIASAALYERFGEDGYKDAALRFGSLLAECQETGPLDGMPLTGFFYTDVTRRHLVHDHHAAFNEAPMLAYAALCRTFPEASDRFREGSRLYLDHYLKPGSELAAPYYLLPAGVFTKAETVAQPGTPVSENYVLRTFPVWTDHIFHGATNFHLSQAWALATAARLLEDREALDLVQTQLEWIMGRNPFSSSLMYGIGYNYAPDFAYCTHNIVGALPVGVDCFYDDQPFWNGTANACSHEIWVEPVSRFTGTLAAFLKD